MTAEASARTGAGLVSVATRPEHAALLNLTRPELMCHAVSAPVELEPLLARASVVAIGPGLGRSDWSRSVWQRVLSTDKPLVVDADALNLMAAEPVWRDAWVLTPHPGEAARLLGCTTGEIQADRFGAVRRLREKYGGICVLKGAGSLVQGGSGRPPAVCTDGNPGMASGGMGDVLTGIIAGLLAQGIGSEDAACMGVCLHGAAADAAARQGERGLLAGDLMPHLRTLVNTPS
jgi:NAD(P)H-hydrate epimerase